MADELSEVAIALLELRGRNNDKNNKEQQPSSTSGPSPLCTPKSKRVCSVPTPEAMKNSLSHIKRGTSTPVRSSRSFHFDNLCMKIKVNNVPHPFMEVLSNCSHCI